MNNKKLSAASLWKHFEDVLAPALRLNHIDRSVYSHLLRHTLLEGRSRLRFSISWLARGSCVTGTTARLSLHRLVDKGAIRLLERSRAGHLIEMRHPHLIRAARGASAQPSGPVGAPAPGSRFSNLGHRRLPPSADLEQLDFMSSKCLRETLHARDRNLCFYCLCRLKPRTRCLDHVVPRVRSGRNSYRNLVAVCIECNSRKRDKPASDHLRWLYRQGRLTASELTARLRALRALAAGKLRPVLPTATSSRPRKLCPPSTCSGGSSAHVGARFSASP